MHERDLSYSNNTGKKENPLATGNFLPFDKVVGGGKRMENNGCARVLG